MNKRRGKLAAALAAGVLVLGGAYALGNQAAESGIAGAGTAADPDGDHRRGHHGPPAALARDLGVSEEALQTAFEELHDEREAREGDRDDRRTEFINAIARELDVDAARVRAALDEAFPGMRRGDRGARGDGRPDRSALASTLAESLNVEQSRVEAALRTVRASHEAEHERRRDQMAAALAEKLDIPADKVRAAMEKLHPAGMGRHGPGDER